MKKNANSKVLQGENTQMVNSKKVDSLSKSSKMKNQKSNRSDKVKNSESKSKADHKNERRTDLGKRDDKQPQATQSKVSDKAPKGVKGQPASNIRRNSTQTKSNKPVKEQPVGTPKGDETSSKLRFYQVVGQVLNQSQTDKVCMLDAPGLSTDPKKFFKANRDQYYVCINTWLCLTNDVAGQKAADELLTLIERKGLRNAVSACKEYCDSIRKCMGGKDYLELDTFLPSVMALEDVKDVFLIFNFPKRFSPKEADIKTATSIKKFYDVNSGCRLYNSSNGITWLEALLADKLSVLFKTFSKRYKEVMGYLRFSNGVCADGKYLQDKMIAYVCTDPDNKFGQYQSVFNCLPKLEKGTYIRGTKNARKGVRFKRPYSEWVSYPTQKGKRYKKVVTYKEYICYTVTPIGVPKTFETDRIICPEAAYAAANKQCILEALRLSYNDAPARVKIFDEKDQNRNRLLAFEGSRDGSYATIDKSSASDSIASSLMARVLPNDVWASIWPFYVHWFEKEDGTLIRKNMAFSSGDPLCFFTLGCLLSALEMVAEDLVSCFSKGCKPKSYKGFAFGDDIITPVDVFETYCDLAKLLGFVINEDKSYAVGGFRESCGCDYYFGYEVTSRYWPRAELSPRDDIESIFSLISLQHKLYNYYTAQRFISRVVIDRFPDMTYSYPGTDCEDLWNETPEVPTVKAPIETLNPVKVFDFKTGRYYVPEIPDAWSLREVHYASYIKNPKSSHEEIVEVYYYLDFLRNGPRYETELDRLLNVSSRVSRAAETGKPVLGFRRSRKS